MRPGMLLLTVSSKTSRKPIKTLDVRDSCYKEWTNVRINVEKKSLQQPKKRTKKRLENKTETLYKGTTKNFEEKTILTAPYEQT